MNNLKICVFTYNFEHKKSQEGIIKLLYSNYKIKQVLGMNKQKIFSPKKKVDVTTKDIKYLHPKKLCKELDIPYTIIKHNSQKCYNYLKKKKFDLGIILGARILKEEIINCFKIGILNMHPGILPENRGLDTYQWAICNMFSQGATAHLIDKKMDRGKILFKKKIKIYSQDNLKDFCLRIQSLELELMIKSLDAIKKNKNYGYYSKNHGKYHSYINKVDEKKMISLFSKYKKKFI